MYKDILMRFLLLLFLICFSAYGDDFTKGKGTFLSTSDDSLGFVKQQLIFEGVKDIITKDLAAISLNPDLFWKKYDERYQEQYSVIDESLKIKYKIDNGANAKDRENYQKKLRRKSLLLKRRIGNLRRVVSSYAIKKISRSASNPNYRVIRIEGKTDKKLLTQIYYSFVKGGSSSQYGTLFLKTKFELEGFTFSEINIESKKEFTDVITNGWVKWLNENKPSSLQAVSFLTQPEEDEIRSGRVEQGVVDSSAKYFNSLVLELTLKIKLNDLDKEVNTYRFTLGGGALIEDAATGRVLETIAFNNTKKTVELKPNMSMANILANSVYRYGSDYFVSVNRKIKQISPANFIQKIQLSNFDKVKNIFELQEAIERVGVKYSVKADLHKIQSNAAELVTYLDGNKENIVEVLNLTKSAKNSTQYDIIDTEAGIEVKFK